MLAARRPIGPYPRPTNGILVAMIVMNSTITSSGKSAIWTMALATWAAISVRALPASIGLRVLASEAMPARRGPLAQEFCGKLQRLGCDQR